MDISYVYFALVLLKKYEDKSKKHAMLNIHKFVESIKIYSRLIASLFIVQVKAIRKKMVEIMTRDIAGSDLKDVVNKLYN